MIAFKQIVFIKVFVEGQIFIFRETCSFNFSATFPDSKDDLPSGSVTLYNIPDDLAAKKNSIEYVEIIAGFQDNFGPIFKGYPKPYGIAESTENSDNMITIELTAASDVLKDFKAVDIPKNSSVYSAILRICQENNLNLKEFSADKNKQLPQGFQIIGSFFDILARMCDILGATYFIDYQNVIVRDTIQAGPSNMYKVSSAKKSLLSYSEGHDDKKGNYVDIECPLLYDIRKGSQIIVERVIRNQKASIQGIVTEVNHTGGSYDYFTTKLRLSV